MFELTPDGLRRESAVVNPAAADQAAVNQDNASAESATPQTARRMDRVLLLVMALALSFFAFDKFVLIAGRMTTTPSVTTGTAKPDGAKRADAASPSNSAAGSAAAPKDIVLGVAVLPFANLSPDPARIKLYRNQDIDAYLEFGKRAGSSMDGEHARLLVPARFVRGDIDGALAVLQVAEQSTTPRQAASLAAYRAELLRLAGRESEADELARSAFEAIREGTDVEQPRADIGAALWYAQAAQIAAQAGERAAAEKWRGKALASPAPSIDERSSVASALSAAARGLGDQEAAWQLLLPFVGGGTPALLAPCARPSGRRRRSLASLTVAGMTSKSERLWI